MILSSTFRCHDGVSFSKLAQNNFALFDFYLVFVLNCGVVSAVLIWSNLLKSRNLYVFNLQNLSKQIDSHKEKTNSLSLSATDKI